MSRLDILLQPLRFLLSLICRLVHFILKVPIHELLLEVKLREHNNAITNKVFLLVRQVLDRLVQLLFSLLEHLLIHKEGLTLKDRTPERESALLHGGLDDTEFPLDVEEAGEG